MFFASVIGVHAQTVRKYSNDFLTIGVGARALGMSGAVAATTKDVTAGYWNPAGLNFIEEKYQAGLMHSEQFGGIASYDYLGGAVQTDAGNLAFSLIRLGVDDIQNTLQLVDQNGNINYNNITKFSTADYALTASFAKELNVEGLYAGGNAKLIYRHIGDFANAFGFGLDFGVTYVTENWNFAAVGKDITSTFSAWSYNLSDEDEEILEATGNEIPENGMEVTLPTLTIGAARHFQFNEKIGMTSEMDLIATFDGQRNTLVSSNFASLSPALGLEFDYNQLVYVRGGLGNVIKSYNTVTSENEYMVQPNLGIGLYLKNFFGLGHLSLDYALANVGELTETPYSNIFSLRFDIASVKN